MGQWEERSWNGSNRCILCKEEGESVNHVFVLCPFSKAIWKVVLHIVNERKKWDKNILLDCIESWMIEKSPKNHSAIRCYVIWGLDLKEQDDIPRKQM